MIDRMLQFYPELDGGIKLAPLLEHKLLEVGGRCRIITSSKYSVSFGEEDRSSGVALAAEERLFLVDFWDKGVQMGSARSSNLDEATGMIHAFLSKHETAAELRPRFPFLTIGEQAQVHEQGAAAEVAWQWENVKQHATEFSPDLLPLLNRLIDRSPLNQLFPYMSLEALCFSRCTGCPYTGDCPVVVALGPDDYEVRDMRGKPFGRGDANTALNLLITNLPSNCGAAVQGTANDIDLGDKEKVSTKKSDCVGRQDDSH
jgi:hypothetical protein